MPDVVVDPVCGMEINLENALERSEYQGQTFYFCSQQCRNKFDEDPAQFVTRAELPAGGNQTQSAT